MVLLLVHLPVLSFAPVLSLKAVLHAAGAKNVLSFTLNSLNSWHSEPQQPQPVSHFSSAHTLSQPATNASASHLLTDTTHKHSPTQQHKFDNTAVDQQANSTSGSKQPANATTNAQSTIAVLHDAQQLFKTAERLIRESCNEQWLMQPFIPDMERNEYR